MMKNKIANEKCLSSGVDSTTSTDNRSDHLLSEQQSSPQLSSNRQAAKLPLGILKQSSTSETTTTAPSKAASPALSSIISTTTSVSAHHAFTRSRSKSSVSYAETSKGFSKTNIVKSPNVVANSDAVKHFNPASSTNISSSFRNALQMPQIAQVFPNLNIPNMSSLPDYLPQLPSVSMPSMPAMPNISLTMPSIPSLSMPSMPNLSMPNISMPSIPSISNINIPSFSEIMNFPIRKNIKTWNEICTSVRDSRKRFNDVCPSLPFNFNFRYNHNNEKLRIYFLSSQNSSETTLFYCDAPLVKQINGLDRSNGTIFEIEEDIMNKMRSDIQASEEAMQTGENDYESVDIGNESDEYRNYYDMDHNMSSKSSSLPSLSSSPSSGSYSHDPSLYRKTVASPTSSMTNFPTLSWKPLIMMNRAYFASNDDNTEFIQSGKSDRSSNKSSTSSHEEDLILQRKRILYNGVISYDFHPGAARFVFTIKNMIYWFDDLEIASQPTGDTSCTTESNSGDENLTDLNVPRSFLRMSEKLSAPPPYIPHKLMTNTHVKMNATICPHNPDVVAYVADSDLWVCDLVSCKEMRLTTTDYAKTGIMAGRPSFVMQEEFSRFNGFWWGPTSPTDTDGQNYTILCEFVDESEVDVCSISSWDGTSEFHRFPKAGCSNAKSSLKLINFQLNDLKTLSKANNNNRDKIVVKELPVNFGDLFPEFEYLVRCGWQSWDTVWAELLNRQQNKLVIVLVSVNFYFPPQIIHEESRENHWYNCHDILYFFAQNDEKSLECYHTKPDSVVQFLWASEDSGFRHLYKISVKIVGNIAPLSEPAEDNDIGEPDSESAKLNNFDEAFFDEAKRNIQPTALKSLLISNHQITNGNWEVYESLFWVDEQKDLVYFLGNKDSPLETHLYVVSSSNSPRVQPRRLTKEDFTHSRVFFDPEFRFCIDFQSNLTMPPFGLFHEVVSPEHASHSVNLEPLFYFLGLSEDVSLDEPIEYQYQDKVQYLGLTPQLFEYKLKSGELVYGFLFKPDFMEPGAKYPVLLEIYGGPEVQLVNKSFRDIRQHRRHLIASEGYVVVGFDSRGSKYRGVEFERHIYKRLGQVEILDQVEALEWLAENTGFMDMSRVAIHGWSYGGYLSLMALAQRPDIFKCAIAGAPVTNWLLYDTGYTERYMGLPEENEEGYRLSNVLSYSKNFPNEYNRLLIIHGLMDENVHFSHTAHLINSLVSQGKPYHLNVFPFERHSLRKLYSSEHYEATLLQYLQQHL